MLVHLWESENKVLKGNNAGNTTSPSVTVGFLDGFVLFVFFPAEMSSALNFFILDIIKLSLVLILF